MSHETPEKIEERLRDAANKRLIDAARRADLGGIRAALADGAEAAWLDEALKAAAGASSALYRKDDFNRVLAIAYLIDCGAGAFEGALYLAAEQGREEVAKLLIERGVSPKAMRKALVAAAGSRREGMACLLLQNGAEPSAKALKAAAAKGDVSMTRLLLEHGAKPGLGALDAAAYRMARETMELLLEHGAPVEGARHLQACFTRQGVNASMIRLLVKCGLQSHSEHLTLAVHRVDHEVVACMLNLGVPLSIRGAREIFKQDNIAMIAYLINNVLNFQEIANKLINEMPYSFQQKDASELLAQAVEIYREKKSKTDLLEPPKAAF